MQILHLNSYYNYYGEPAFYKSLYDLQITNGINISVYLPTISKIVNTLNFGNYTKVVRAYHKYDRIFFHLKENKINNLLVKSFNIKEYDIMHAHSTFSNGYLALKNFKKYGVPYIVAVRDTDMNIFFKRMLHLRNLGNEILFNAEAVIFISQSYKEKTISEYIQLDKRLKIEGNSHVIPNGINNYWFQNKNNAKKIGEGTIKLLYVGRISKRKNLLVTVKACEILLEQGYNVSFTIIGSVDDEKVFSKILCKEYVQYFASMPKEDLIYHYRNNDIFVMPSKTETFGLVYAEAMSQGMPIIYTKNQGFDKQFAEGKVGFSVQSNAEEEIVEKIKMILEDFNNISKRCLLNVDKFKWQNIESQYKQLYLRIIKSYNI
ncbi:hypothetical protein DH09_13855 [Bacillaceae bacterium JMAK1]|nr:hypothetical protein DH09_13855 [Bacillaceae bacterium JMAK1]